MNSIPVYYTIDSLLGPLNLMVIQNSSILDVNGLKIRQLYL